jgi:general nucleoside transport system permease protein
VAVVAAAGFGAAWAFVPALLQARRRSHLVIITIMFNFIATALMTWLLVEVLIAPDQSALETRTLPPVLWLPTLTDLTTTPASTPAGRRSTRQRSWRS